MQEVQTLIKERLAHDNHMGILGNQGYVLGIDLGAYGLRAVLIDLHSHSLSTMHTDISGAPPADISSEALSLARQLLSEHGATSDKLVRIGVGFGGPVDPHSGVVRLSPRTSHWENFSIKNHFEDALDTVTLVDNDANLIALGEATFGVGKNYKHLCYLHLSSGVGGGIVLDGRLYHGATATAGEIGHAIVSTRMDSLGRLPTLEELVSIEGILQRARHSGFATDNLHDIFSGNPIGQEIIRETVDLIALHMAQVVALIDPQIIVLGGIVVRIGGHELIDKIAQQMAHYIHPHFARPVKVVASALGTESVAIGALALALQSLQD